MKRFLVSVGAAALMLAVSAGGAAAQSRGVDATAGFVTGEVVVGFRWSATAAQIGTALAAVGGVSVSQFSLPETRVMRVRLADATAGGTEAAVKQLRENPALVGKIRYAEPNIIQQAHDLRQPQGVAAQTQSNDPSLTEQWGYYDISANWVQPTGYQRYIAVIDTGVDYNHPELVGKVIKGKDFVNNDMDPMDDMGHGTHVSGIAAGRANNAFGIAGVAWNAKILAVKVLDAQGYGNIYDIARGIRYAADNYYVRVINMSLGGSGLSSLEQDAVNYAVNTKNKLLVASAGNSGTSAFNYPAAFSQTFPGKVIAVAAHQPDHCRATFSTYGTWVTISAPGTDILSAVPAAMMPGQNGFDIWDGTSMAAPFVAGAAEVVWAKYPAYTNLQISNVLTTNADSLGARDGSCWPLTDGAYGRLNLLFALNQINSCGTAETWPYGYASDASNGEPLAGAKVQALQGYMIKGTDYVPYYGYRTDQSGVLQSEGYGLFSAAAQPITAPTVDAKITKPGYAPYTAKNLPFLSCQFTYAGNIPIPPTTGLYWVAVTTNYGQTLLNFDLYGKLPSGTYIGYPTMAFGDEVPGDLNAAPYMKWLWDSDNPDYTGSLRFFSETIRLKQQVPGTYQFFVSDFAGAGDQWSTAGAKAYIYRGTTLIKEITPPAGTGQYWYLADISGWKVTEVNTISAVRP